MTTSKIPLASDNWAPVHPLILQAVIGANEGEAPGYGSDPWTKAAERLILQEFQREGKVFFVPSGTGCNVFALKLGCRRYQSVVCTNIAHIDYQESGAAESIVGCKLITVPHQQGKLTPDALLKALKRQRAFGKHSTSPCLVSITQPTEIGTVYTIEEIQALKDLCVQEKLLLHVDGSRLYQAAASLSCELKEFACADLLSLGGTKIGLMGAEALLIFNPELEEGSDHLQKQTLLLLSKTRYLSAQYIPLFTQQLWKTLATHANTKAQEIGRIIERIPQLRLSYPVQSNQVFFTAPADWIPWIQDKIHCYLWDVEKNELRLITSWNTSEEVIKDMENILISLR